MDWLQVGAFFVAALGLGLAGMVYVTRQFNRMGDRINDRFDRMDDRITRLEERIDVRMTRLEERMGRLEQRQTRVEERLDRVDERLDRMDGRLDQLQVEVKSLGEGLQNVEKEQARMLGFLEGRGVMGKAPADVETVS